MNREDRHALLAFGIFLMIIGTLVGFALPYTATSKISYYNPATGRMETTTTRVTMYGHPIGWGIDGIGFILFLVGLFIDRD